MASSQDNASNGSRSNRHISQVILAENGRNFLAWKTLIPVLLQSEEHAWEVTTGTLKPVILPPNTEPTPEQTKQQEQYTKGNKLARNILLNSIHPNILVDTFYSNSETITAPEIWKLLKGKFTKKSGILKDLAISKFMSYRYKTNRSVNDNLTYFNRLMYSIDELGATLDRSFACARLVDSLPSDWEPFKLSWGTKSNSEKDIDTLFEMIRGESARRGNYEIDQTTAFLSRMTTGPRGRKIFRRRYSNTQTRNTFTRHSEITCYNCGKRGHGKWNCTATKRNTHTKQRKGESNLSEAFMVQAFDCEPEDCQANDNELFIIDSGSSHHIVNDKRWFIKYSTFSNIRNVRVGSSHVLRAMGEGTVILTVCDSEGTSTLELSRVLYVPRMRKNLISVGQLADNGYTTVTDKSKIMICNDSMNKRVHGERQEGLFVLRVNTTAINQWTAEGLQVEISLKDAHTTLTHIGKEKVKRVLTQEGIAFKDDLNKCDACIKGKQNRASYKSKPIDTLAQSTGHIHADLCSPSIPSLGGAKYFLCLTDEYSKYRKVYFLKTKDETANCI